MTVTDDDETLYTENLQGVERWPELRLRIQNS